MTEKLYGTDKAVSKWEKAGGSFIKIFSVSLDELVDNDVQDLIVEKVSNTENLAGII